LDVDFLWQDVVIGNEINAIRYSTERKACLLRNRASSIHSYELYSNSTSSIEDIWSAESYRLYEAGQDPFTNTVRLARVDPDRRVIRITTNSHKTYVLSYEHLHVFDMCNVEGLEEYFTQQQTSNRVLDWFDARSVRGEQDGISTNDNFVKNVHFFKSCRIDGNTEHQDIVCESFLSNKQLKSADYSDTMSRFKTIHELSKLGYTDVELTLWKRDIIPLFKTNYKKTNNISWRGIPDEEEYYKKNAARNARK
jgi:hypothetical protein